MIEGGCDISDEFLPYVATGLVALRTSETLREIQSDKEIELNGDEERRMRQISDMLYGAVSWIHGSPGRITLHEATERQMACDLVRRLSPLGGSVMTQEVIVSAEGTRHSLNAVLVGQLPSKEELEQANDFCMRLSELCHSLASPQSCT